jgi:hypothetical protein
MSRVQVQEPRQVAPHEIALMDALVDSLIAGDTDFYIAHEQEWASSSLGGAFRMHWSGGSPPRPVVLDAQAIWDKRNGTKPVTPANTTQAIWDKWNDRH